jgi:hypothetical protein
MKGFVLFYGHCISCGSSWSECVRWGWGPLALVSVFSFHIGISCEIGACCLWCLT